jgi:hypothetical protein
MKMINTERRISRKVIRFCLIGSALTGMLTTVEVQAQQTGASTATSSSATSNGPGGTTSGSAANDRSLNPGYRPPTGQLTAPQQPAVYDGLGRKQVAPPYVAPPASPQSGPTGSGTGSSAKARPCAPGVAC